MRRAARLFDLLRREVAYAARGLRRSPGFSILVIAILALGIGTNTAVFGIVDRLMFRPPALLRDPGTVHRVYGETWNRGKRTTRADGEYTRYLELRRWSRTFSELAAFTHRPLAVGDGLAARERTVAAVSASFFGFFDAPPTLGRYFTEEEDTIPRGADVAVLSFETWQTDFGGRDVRGQRLQVGTIEATIIGVAPRGLAGVSDGAAPAVYVPITTFAVAHGNRRDPSAYYTNYAWRWMEVMVRRKPGVSVEEASADATLAMRQSWNRRREFEPSLPTVEEAQPRAVIGSLHVGAGPAPGLEARTTLWVAGVALAVLLIACANVANLFLARGLRRRQEIAVRLALGVSRRRLAFHAMVEGVLLSAVGGMFGLLLAHWTGATIHGLLTGVSDATTSALSDWRTIAGATGCALVAGLVAGGPQAFFWSRSDLGAALRGTGVASRSGNIQLPRLRMVFLVAQGALSVMLLVGAGLFVRSLAHVNAMRLGYDPDGVLLVTQNLRGVRLDEAGLVALRRTLVETAQGIPGVEAASAVMTVPFRHTNATAVYVPGVDSMERFGQFTYQSTTPDYFRVMGTRIIQGRGVSDADRADAPKVAVVSATMARTLWPGESAIGRCLRVFADTMPCATVVGVAEDIVQGGLAHGGRLHYYLPMEQFWPAGSIGLLLRVRGDAARDAERIRRALQGVMPGTAYVTTERMRDLVAGARRSWHLGATMFGALGLLALLVAAVGLYGVVSYDVSQRMHELGVRVALGARPADAMQLIVGHGIRQAGAGIAAGTLLSVAAGHWLEPLLFEQRARDPVVFAVVVGVLVAVTVLASAIPAFRASRADPNVVLRTS